MPTATMTKAIDYAIDAVVNAADGADGQAKGSKTFWDASWFDPTWLEVVSDCYGVVQEFLNSRPELKAHAASMKSSPRSSVDIDFSSPEYWRIRAYGLTAPIYAARPRAKRGPIPRELAQDPKFAALKASVLSCLLQPVIYALTGEPFKPDAVGVPEVPSGATKGWLSDAWDAATDWADDHIDEAIDYAWDYLNR